MRDYFTLTDNTPVAATFEEYYQWTKQQPENWFIVKQDEVNGYWVSTVYLHGINHNWGAGPPILWETMIFRGKGPSDSTDYQRRYSSHAEAVAGHVTACDKAKNLPEEDWDDDD